MTINRKVIHRNILYRTILPITLTLLLSLATVFLFILPSVKERLMDDRREMLKELTTTVVELLTDYHNRTKTKELTPEEAKRRAILRIKTLRYGPELKDYFWINDLHPNMIMHPYRTDLDGTDISNFADPNGKLLFIEMVETVKANGEGYVDYMWQWKDDPERIVPKLSFVKGFEPWGWILGTGIYIEDVNEKIVLLTRNINLAFSILLSLLALLSVYIILQAEKAAAKSIETEAAKQASEKKYRQLVETMNDGMVIVDQRERFSYVNATFCEITGYSADDLIGKSIYDLLDGENIKTLEYQMAMRRQGHDEKYELTWTRPNGQKLHTIISPRPFFDENGNFNGSFAVITDITARKMAEKEVIKTQNYLQQIFNSIHSMLITVDPNGMITRWNEKTEAFTGIPSDQAQNRNVWEFIPFLSKYKNTMQAVADNGDRVEFLKETMQSDYTSFYAVSFYPMIFGDNKGVIIRIDDVTDQEYKDIQLLQAQKMETIGNLAGGLAHDFNNVLAGIVGTVSVMEYRIKKGNAIDTTSLEKYMELIKSAGSRATDIVKQLLTLSRRREPVMERLNLYKALENVRQILRNTLDKSIRLEFRLHNREASIQGDVTQVEQVILNLCVNAAHAMTIMRDSKDQYGGLLDVSLEEIFVGENFSKSHPDARVGAYYVLRVHDTGVGMCHDTISRIFEPFFTTKDAKAGTGLGLSMVFNIVKQHGGFIHIYSEPQIGSTFNVFFPKKKAQVKGEREEFTETVVRGEGTILIVDDEDIVRELAKEMLESCGYRTLEAQDGKEGVERFKQWHDEIDAVLLDLAMPQMSGREAFFAMQEFDPEVKVLLASGFKQDSRVQELLDNGILGFIQKPYTISKISHKLAGILK